MKRRVLILLFSYLVGGFVGTALAYMSHQGAANGVASIHQDAFSYSLISLIWPLVIWDLTESRSSVYEILRFSICILLPTVAAYFVLRHLFPARACVEGVCHSCGYDLRASNERCPECGTPIPTPVAAPPEDRG